MHLADLDWIKRAIVQRMSKPEAEADTQPVPARNFDAESGPLKPGKFDARNGGKKKDEDDDDDDGGADHEGEENQTATPLGGNGNRTP